MTFENPNALWLLLALPPLLLGLGLWGWRAKKEAAEIFPSSLRRLGRKQIEKYIIAGVLMVFLVVVIASPKIVYTAPAPIEKTGEIALLIDVSTSMAAQEDIDSPNRLERIKPILYEIVDNMEKLGQVKISLHGFTNIARSHVPLVGKEDYPYLKESIKKLLDINSIPGKDTSFGIPLINVAEKFNEGEQAKIIILFSDGEPFFGSTIGMTGYESVFLERAVGKTLSEGIKVITVGVGEKEGAKIPLYDSYGEFTGNYALKRLGVDYVSYLEEDVLKEIASLTNGKYFYEKNLKGLMELIEENLDVVATEQVNKEIRVYQSIDYWLVLAALPLWVIFVRRYLLG